MRQWYLDCIQGERHGIAGPAMRSLFGAASIVYNTIFRLVRFWRSNHARQLPLAVISVGNVTWGGTGKTPFVTWLIEYYRKQNKKVMVLMRGYGGDEHLLLRERYPDVAVLAGKKRYTNGQKYLQHGHADVCILDDGFQHWQIRRDLDIVLINCLEPWGNGHLIPRGMLREPVAALARADGIVLTNANLISDAALAALQQTVRGRVAADVPVIMAAHTPIMLYRAAQPSARTDPGQLRGARVLALCGIGTPRSFIKTLENAGAVVEKTFCFPDHHRFSVDDLKPVKQAITGNAQLLCVTTEKDFRRCPAVLAEQVNPLVICVAMKLWGEYAAFNDRLNRVLGR